MDQDNTKRNFLMSTGLLAGSAALLGGVAQSANAQACVIQSKAVKAVVAGYAELRALCVSNLVDGDIIKMTNNGIAGDFVVKTLAASGLTDYGTLFSFNDSPSRYAQRIHSGFVNVRWFVTNQDLAFSAGSPVSSAADRQKNTAAIQNAVNYAQVSRGRLFFPCGIYEINTIFITTDLVITGEASSGTTIRFSGSAGFSVCKTSPYAYKVEITDVTLVKLGESGVGIDVCSDPVTISNGFIQNLLIERVHLQSCNYGIRVSNTRNSTVRNCTSIHCDTVLSLSGQVVLSLIDNNDFQAGLANGIYGILVEGNDNFSDGQYRIPENVKIKNNRIYGYNQGIVVRNVLFGIISHNDIDETRAHGISIDTATDLTVTGNWIAIQNDNPQHSTCVEILGASGYSPAGNGIYIRDNRMRSYTGNCLAGVHIGNFRSDILVDGNSTMTGIIYGCFADQFSRNISITNNNFASSIGFSSAANVENVTIANNILSALDVTNAQNVKIGDNVGDLITSGVVVVTIPAGETAGSAPLPAPLPTGASILHYPSDSGGLSRNGLYTRLGDDNRIYVEADTVFGVATGVRVHFKTYK